MLKIAYLNECTSALPSYHTLKRRSAASFLTSYFYCGKIHAHGPKMANLIERYNIIITTSLFIYLSTRLE